MRQLGIFAKYWEPGQVKTRLAASIGDLWASRLYQLFLEQTISNLQGLDANKSLCFWPAESRQLFQPLVGESWTLVPQVVGDLGMRLAAFFRATCEDQSPTIVIGSDSPNLPFALIEQGFESLKRSEVVIGPSSDGGYYLIGMRKLHVELFHDIPWSTSDVLAKTRQRCADMQLELNELAPWRDVDELEDLKWLMESTRFDESAMARRIHETIATCLAEQSP